MENLGAGLGHDTSRDLNLLGKILLDEGPRHIKLLGDILVHEGFAN